MWILVEMTNTYILKCSHCEASGNYRAAEQSVQADLPYRCSECGHDRAELDPCPNCGAA